MCSQGFLFLWWTENVFVIFQLWTWYHNEPAFPPTPLLPPYRNLAHIFCRTQRLFEPVRQAFPSWLPWPRWLLALSCETWLSLHLIYSSALHLDIKHFFLAKAVFFLLELGSNCLVLNLRIKNNRLFFFLAVENRYLE